MIRNVLLGVILTFVVIFLILLIIYTARLNTESGSVMNKKTKQLPPWNYFRKVSSHCPDYWENVGVDSSTGEVMCRNTMNVPIHNTDLCYDNDGDKTKSFKLIDFNTEVKLSDGKKILPSLNPDSAIAQRCDFVKNCGPTATEKAAWIGFDNGSSGYAVCN